MHSTRKKSADQFYFEALNVFSRYLENIPAPLDKLEELLQVPAFKEIMKVSPGILWLADLHKASYIFISDNIKDILGHDKEAFYKDGLKKTITLFPEIQNEILLKKIFPTMFDFFDKYALSGDLENIKASYPSLIMCGDGKNRWFLHQATIVKLDESNRPHIMMKLVMDIDDIKKEDNIPFVISKKNEGGSYQTIFSETYVTSMNGEKLSSRELEILKMIKEGKTSKDIGQVLCLSVHTIKTHRKNMMKKLQASGAFDLIRKAEKAQII